MNSWPTVSLIEVCDIAGGTQPPKETFRYEPTDGYVRMLQIQDFKSDESAVYIPKGARMKTCTERDVLIARYGASIGRILRGKAGAYNVALVKTVPDASLLERNFLYHLLNGHSFQNFILNVGSRAAQAGFNKGDLERFDFVLPPLAEQRRIAEVLDRAEALRAKRRAALAQLDSLTQSIFLDLFGDPAANGWAMTDIAGVAKPVAGSIRTGPFGSQLLHSEFTDHGIAVLGIDNAVMNEFRWSERRFISEAKYRQLKRYTVRPGDVLITIMGTCGRCAIVPDDTPPAINTKHLCCITLDPAKCLPIFLHAYFLQHPISRKYLNQTAKGAIMSGLNMALIKGMPMLLPPIELQREFARRVCAVEKLKKAQRASLAELDALFAALQHRAFRGELK